MTDAPLVHIGLHKTATTWLQRQFFQEPNGFTLARPIELADDAFVAVNGLDFDPKVAREKFAPLLERAQQDGTVAVISHERLSSHPLIDGVDAQPIADRVAATFPEARILIVIREQTQMLISFYKQYLQQDLAGTEPLARLWRDRNIAARRWPEPGLGWFAFHHLITYYRERFGADRVLVLPYEILVQDPKGFIQRVADFARSPVPPSAPQTRENVSSPAAHLAALRYFNMLLRVLDVVPNRFYTRKRIRAIRRRFLAIVSHLIPGAVSRRVEKRWHAAAHDLIAGRFEESNAITNELAGIDLGAYGYAVGPSRLQTST